MKNDGSVRFVGGFYSGIYLFPKISSGPLLMMDVATNPSTSTTHFEQGETPSISRSDLEQSDNEDDCRTIFIDHNPVKICIMSKNILHICPTLKQI